MTRHDDILEVFAGISCAGFAQSAITSAVHAANAFTLTNFQHRRTLDCNNPKIAEVSSCLASVIQELSWKGIL